MVQRWAAFAKEKPVSHATFIRQATAAKFFKTPKAISKPMLFVGAKGDKIAHYSCTEKLAKNYKNDLVIHPTGGHDLALDAPEWLVEQMKTAANKFLN